MTTAATIDVSPARRNPASFRDPSGFVFHRGGEVLRQVNHCWRHDYDRLTTSGLHDELVQRGLLIPHEVAPLDERASDEAYQVLRPARLPLVSYPYEWCFSQLRDAALATLEIQRRALARGMTLKDASAYNIQRYQGRPTLIDTLSFERYEPGRPWAAYRQFCQHFLAPLALASRTDVRLSQLSRLYIDGVPLDLASRLLPWRTRWSLSLGLHIHAHARRQRKAAHGQIRADSGARLSRRQLDVLLSSLETTVAGLSCNAADSEWSDYYVAKHNYGAAGLEHKERLVRQLFTPVEPRTVWDLGANDGRFSRTALAAGAKTVVAWDIDPACVERNYRQAVQRCESALHPLLLDLSNPTPGVGWANAERLSLVERGPVDLVLALGLVHHLAIANQVPLPQVATYLARLAKCLLIEWVPKEDSQVQKLLAGRRDVFAGYKQPDFEAAFRRHFRIVRTAPIEGTQRTLYLCETNHAESSEP